MITGRFEQAAWLVAEIDHRRDFWTPQRHPFYMRWAAGELTDDDLQAYAAEHHHVIVALADAAARAADRSDGLLGERLAAHAQAREDEIELWCHFARATGWSSAAAWYFGADPLPETELAARAWVGDEERTLAEHLVTIYALETIQGDVARLQLDGLLGHYAFAGDADTRYFELRLRGDDGPAGLLEAALTGLLPVPDPFALVRHAELVFRSYWDLLNGVTLASAALRG